jgi:hypothetical protein
MLRRAATLLYELLDILHDLVGLLGWVVAANISGRIEVLWALATEIDGSAPACDNRLTQIVVELLLWIRILCVELANSSMGHLGSPSGWGSGHDIRWLDDKATNRGDRGLLLALGVGRLHRVIHPEC